MGIDLLDKGVAAAGFVVGKNTRTFRNKSRFNTFIKGTNHNLDNDSHMVGDIQLSQKKLECLAYACYHDLDDDQQQIVSILDIGCGDETATTFLQENNSYLPSSRIDYSRIDIIENFFERMTHDILLDDDAVLLLGHSLDTSYQVILFNGSFHFFDDTSKVLQRTAQFLSPGGRIVIYFDDISSDVSLYTKHTCLQVAKDFISSCTSFDFCFKDDDPATNNFGLYVQVLEKPLKYPKYR